ncbi:MAG: HPr kinase/phosphatase C-terminal domain-containing protein [Sphingomonas fennica]
MSAPIHATCVAIEGRGVLLLGPPGAGKSDLALRLIDRGARLVADDGVALRADGDRLVASAPPTITGQMEVRGLGILPFAATEAAVALAIDLVAVPERMAPDPLPTIELAGVAVPHLALDGRGPSAAIRVELALRHLVPAP